MKKDLKELVNLYTGEANKNSWYWEINEKKRLTETEVEQSFKETAVTIIEHYCDSHNNNIENAKEFSKILNTELSNKFEKQYGLKPKTEIDENFVEEARSEYIISQYPTPEIENKLWEHYEKTGEFIQYDEMDKEHYEKTGEIIKKEEALKENQKEDFSDKENTMEQKQEPIEKANLELVKIDITDESGNKITTDANGNLLPTMEIDRQKLSEILFKEIQPKLGELNKLEKYEAETTMTSVTDLIEMKKLLIDDEFSKNDSRFNDFEKKVDAHLVYHICDKFYTDDNDRQFFKQSKIAYDDNGFIQKIQAIGDNNWVDIKDFKNVEELEKYFSEIKNVKQENEVKQQQPTEKENNKNDEFSFMIKVSPIEEGFDKKIKKFCDEHNLFDKVWQGDEAKHFTRFMSETIDKQVWENAISQSKIPTSKVKLEVNFNSGESVNIDVPLGKRLFENADIQKLISVSQKELSVNQISDETARNWNELMRKNEKGEYVTKVNNHTIENMFNGGMEGLAKSAQSIGDEHLTAFVQGFASAYGFSKVAPTQEKVFDKNAEKQPNLAEKIDNLTQTVANQSKENSQEKQSKKSSEITQDEMNAIKEETNKVGNEVLNKGKKPKDKNISKPTDISM